MKYLLVALACHLLTMHSVISQKYFTKNAHISFYSDTPMEKIEAHNRSSICIIDFSDGKIEMSTLIKGFQFEKALMQEHFNENYMESDLFPKSTFKGNIVNYQPFNFSEDKQHQVQVSGELTLHGVTRKVNTQATITISKDKIKAESVFHVLVGDYGISIPSIVADNIAKSVKITVEAPLQLLK